MLRFSVAERKKEISLLSEISTKSLTSLSGKLMRARTVSVILMNISVSRWFVFMFVHGGVRESGCVCPCFQFSC